MIAPSAARLESSRRAGKSMCLRNSCWERPTSAVGSPQKTTSLFPPGFDVS